MLCHVIPCMSFDPPLLVCLIFEIGQLLQVKEVVSTNMVLQEVLLVCRIIILLYLGMLLTQSILYAISVRQRSTNRWNMAIHALVVLSFLFAFVQLAVNMWGVEIAGESVEQCATWRGRLFYQLNMIRRTTPKWILRLSTYIIFPSVGIPAIMIVIFFLLYFSPLFPIMNYRVSGGECRSGTSKGTSSVWKGLGQVFIILIHLMFLFLFLFPLLSNKASEGTTATVASTLRTGDGQTKVTSILDMDRALIRKMVIVTVIVIASDFVFTAMQLILKKWDVELSSQALLYDLQTLVTCVSNVLGWKTWQKIVLPAPRYWMKQLRSNACTPMNSSATNNTRTGQRLNSQNKPFISRSYTATTTTSMSILK
eukprot:sb/3465888/